MALPKTLLSSLFYRWNFLSLWLSLLLQYTRLPAIFSAYRSVTNLGARYYQYCSVCPWCDYNMSLGLNGLCCWFSPYVILHNRQCHYRILGVSYKKCSNIFQYLFKPELLVILPMYFFRNVTVTLIQYPTHGSRSKNYVACKGEEPDPLALKSWQLVAFLFPRSRCTPRLRHY